MFRRQRVQFHCTIQLRCIVTLCAKISRDAHNSKIKCVSLLQQIHGKHQLMYSFPLTRIHAGRYNTQADLICLPIESMHKTLYLHVIGQGYNLMYFVQHICNCSIHCADNDKLLTASLLLLLVYALKCTCMWNSSFVRPFGSQVLIRPALYRTVPRLLTLYKQVLGTFSLFMHVIGGFCIGNVFFSLVYDATKLLTHDHTK